MKNKYPLYTGNDAMHLRAHLTAAKTQSAKLTMHLVSESSDSVLKARAANIISLMTDALEQLDTVEKELGWTS